MKFAGFWRRFGAGFIDHILVFAIASLILFLFGESFISCRDPQGWQGCIHSVTTIGNAEYIGWFNNINVNYSVWLSVWVWLYFACFQSSKYQATPGMMLLSMRIENYDKKRISFWRATGRFLASYLSTFFFFIGYIMIAFTPRKQALHDYIAKTLVVTTKPR